MEKTYKILKLVILLLSLVVLILGAGKLYNSLSSQVQMDPLAAQPAQPAQDPEQTEPKKTPAPDFTVYDLQGNPHKLSDYQGKPVILNFWASWCGPCKMEMPDFEEKYQQYGEMIQFLMVNLTDGSQETVEHASAFITEQGYSFPVFYDTDMSGAIAYGVTSIPATYFIDGEGNLVTYARGALTADNLQSRINLLLQP